MIPRYSLPRMTELWSEQSKFQCMLEVELAACDAMSKLGVIPKSALKNIKSKARFELSRIKELERLTNHDVVAFINNVSENIGEDARYLHFGLTSSDVLDTSLALLMKRSAEILIEDLKALLKVLRRQARRYKKTPMVGRTHGVYAEPITFGFKLAIFYDEFMRNLHRMKYIKDVVSVGKISGAVGTYANIDPFVEKYVCERLGLIPAKISSQIVQRDRHAEYLCIIAIIGSSLERLALEIRHLHRSEVDEVKEYFSSTQKGSSAMPHKKNPIMCERICGLVRILRANALAELESVALWHERDISHSSVERIVIPDSSILLDYLLNKMTKVLQDMVVSQDAMQKNLNASGGIIFSQRLLLKLIEKGLSRQEAYDIVQRCALKVGPEGPDFKQIVMNDAHLRRYLHSDEVEECFQLKTHLKYIDKVFKEVGL